MHTNLAETIPAINVSGLRTGLRLGRRNPRPDHGAAQPGAAVLLVSEDLDEILELADRVAVTSEGRINYVAPVADTDRTTIGQHMAGH